MASIKLGTLITPSAVLLGPRGGRSKALYTALAVSILAPLSNEFADLYQDVAAYAAAHPDRVRPEPDPVPPSQAELDAARRAEIIARFARIDADSVRPLRAMSRNEATEDDVNKLAALDVEADALRVELGGMPVV